MTTAAAYASDKSFALLLHGKQRKETVLANKCRALLLRPNEKPEY
jgi:hypothetical protein